VKRLLLTSSGVSGMFPPIHLHRGSSRFFDVVVPLAGLLPGR
jgi:hypothetical protein